MRIPSPEDAKDVGVAAALLTPPAEDDDPPAAVVVILHWILQMTPIVTMRMRTMVTLLTRITRIVRNGQVMLCEP